MILPQETETTLVSNCQLLLYSQPAGLLVELVTSGVEHPDDMLANARDFAFDAFELLPLLHRANVFSGFSSASLATRLISFKKMT